MYAHEMMWMEALPKGAAATALIALVGSEAMETTGWEGRKGARCSETQMGLGRRSDQDVCAECVEIRTRRQVLRHHVDYIEV